MFPLVSVVIATYNWKEKWFTQTIESVFSQSYKNIELIIVNDASTNNIEEVIFRYCKKYNNITYLKNEKNSERSYSRNRGIFESKWKYIAFLDDDDIRWDKYKIEKQVEFLEKNVDYVMCGTSSIVINEYNDEIKKIIANHGDRNLKKRLFWGNEFILSSVMIRKEVCFFAGVFSTDKNFAEDYDLWLRIWRYGKINNIDDLYIFYRTRTWNTTTTRWFEMKKLAFESIWSNRKYYNSSIFLNLVKVLDFLIPYNLKSYIPHNFKEWIFKILKKF